MSSSAVKTFRRAALLSVVVLVTVISMLAVRLSRTPEWQILAGGLETRQTVCRTVYRKSRGRAQWCLARLLSDRSPLVRVPAIEALSRRPDLHGAFANRIRQLTRDPSPLVRGRALEFIFQRQGTLPDDALQQALTELEDPVIRDQHPDLVSFVLTTRLDRGDEDAVTWALDLLEQRPDQDRRPLHTLARYPDLLRPFRSRMVNALDHGDGNTQALLVACLAAVDGRMRGTTAADWRQAGDTDPADEIPATPHERFTVEAEWAQRVVPNFHVDTHEGELGVFLGEGAGGDHFWRRHEYSTVDIGKLHYTFAVASTGSYQLWCRCWFGDKCGNHSLLHIDGRWYQWKQAGYEDRNDILRAWHWKRLDRGIRLKEGKHTLTITAGDDGLAYDKLAILPSAEQFDPDAPPPLAPLFDTSVPGTVALTPERQSQSRGTEQTIRVWVRRNRPTVTEGTVILRLPPPFVIISAATADIAFEEGVPLARATFRVRVPEDAVGGEGLARAVFRCNGRDLSTGTLVLGVNYDWQATAPLTPGMRHCRELRQRRTMTAADLNAAWSAYPPEGFDRYRRLMFEQVHGQRHDCTVFLYTEIEASEAGDYTSFLTLDDSGAIFIDGRRVAGRSEGGVGEGWMLVDTVHLTAGRHRVFAWVYQTDFPEPEGPDAGRHTPNHWTFKWLLRKSRHEPAPGIRGVPVSRWGEKSRFEN